MCSKQEVSGFLIETQPDGDDRWYPLATIAGGFDDAVRAVNRYARLDEDVMAAPTDRSRMSRQDGGSWNVHHSGVTYRVRLQVDRDKVAELRAIVDAEVPIEQWSNDELLALGIGHGISGPLSDEQVVREARERLTEIEGGSVLLMRAESDTFWKLPGSGWWFALDGVDYGPYANRQAAELVRSRILNAPEMVE
jgi:hypothetical protein